MNKKLNKLLTNATPALIAGVSLVLICTDFNTAEHNAGSLAGGIIGLVTATGIAYCNMVEAQSPKNNNKDKCR